MPSRRQRPGQRGRRETLASPDNKVPRANPETRVSRVMPAERAKRAVKGKRAETEIKDGPEIRDVPATRDEKARTHRVPPENIAIQILTPEKPVALETTDLPGNYRSQVQTSK
jgi:hypothetical protein